MNERDAADQTIRAVRDLASSNDTLDALEVTENDLLARVGEVARRYDVMISLTVTPYDHDAVASVEDAGSSS